MEKPHAIVIPYPAQGHVAPMLELSVRLATHGIKVTFINSDFNHERVIKSLSPDPESDVRRVVSLVSIPDGLEPWEDRSNLEKVTKGIYRVMPGEVERLIEKSNGDGEGVSCVIADGCVTWAQEVAEKMGIRRAAFWPNCAATVASFLSIPEMVRDGVIDGDGKVLKKQMVQLAPDTPPVHSSNLTWASLGDEGSQKAVYDMLSQVHSVVKLTHRQICNSSHNLEPGAFSSYPSITPVGPLLAASRLSPASGHFWPANPSCLAWLDSHPPNSVIYVAFGSFALLDRTQFRELALGLELTNRPFLWVVRPDMVAGKNEEEEAWPEGFVERVGERGRVVGWAPQQQVLCHPSFGCFVSHCGWNSTVEGVWGAVPFVCWPYFGDQFLNEAYICDEWRVGVRLGRDGRGFIGHREIKEKVERVLGDKGYKERALELKRKTMDSVIGGKSHENFQDFIKWVKKG